MKFFEWSPEFKRERKILGFSILGFLGLFILFVTYVIITMPDLSELENPEIDLSTQIISSDNKVLGNYFREYRVNARLDSISINVRNALIATEDKRFVSHSGIDPYSFLTLFYRNLLKGQKSGGSTITMQLSRNLYDAVGQERNIFRKAKELIVAVILERMYSKDEILASYLNTVSFGGNSYGIQAGSRVFFNKDCKNLELHEAALLVGMLKGTSYFNPINHPKRALNRRNTVIALMVENNFISEGKGEKYKAMPMGVKYQAESHNEGLAPYFREYLRKWLKKWSEERGYSLYKDGLKVYTTIDAKMQFYAEEAVKLHLSNLQPVFDKQLSGKEPWKKNPEILKRAMKQSYRYLYAKNTLKKTESEILREFNTKISMNVFSWNGSFDTIMSPWDSLIFYNRFLETGMMVVDPYNGHIKVWVGGIDHKYFQYDHVKQGKRQVGSTFKPFVYGAAFESGKFSPCDELLNQPVYFYREDGSVLWSPKNADGKIGGKLTLRRALANSVNMITAQVIKAIGPEVVAEYAYKMGIESKLDPVPSLSLGTTDLSVYELTGAYSTFVNKGIWNEPVFVTRIEDKNGNVIQEFVGERREALSEATAYQMVDMLKGVVNEPGGTAASLRSSKYGLTMELGGKTGTTQNQSDGWFMGISPHLVAGIWVGCADRNVHFSSLAYGQGARLALPIFGYFMKGVYADSELSMPIGSFSVPDNFQIELDCNKYRIKQGNYNSGQEDEPSKSSLNYD
jgi:penicillin-binding protein 1A